MNLFEGFDCNEYDKVDLVRSMAALSEEDIDKLSGMRFYYVYRIINLINGKFYIGVHGGYDGRMLDDGYYGSGLIIKEAIKKYGIDNFKKDVIIIANSIEEAYDYESQIVTEELVDSDECYNIALGGFGGWPTCSTPEVRAKAIKKATETIRKRLDSGDYNLDYLRTEEVKNKIIATKRRPGGYYDSGGQVKAGKKAYATALSSGGFFNWLNSTHTEKANRKRSSTNKARWESGDESIRIGLSAGHTKWICSTPSGMLRVGDRANITRCHKDWTRIVEITKEQYDALSRNESYDMTPEELIDYADKLINQKS